MLKGAVNADSKTLPLHLMLKQLSKSKEITRENLGHSPSHSSGWCCGSMLHASGNHVIVTVKQISTQLRISPHAIFSKTFFSSISEPAKPCNMGIDAGMILKIMGPSNGTTAMPRKRLYPMASLSLTPESAEAHYCCSSQPTELNETVGWSRSDFSCKKQKGYWRAMAENFSWCLSGLKSSHSSVFCRWFAEHYGVSAFVVSRYCF